ncbi:MAG: DNA repair protein RadA [Miltoncostaeaceae bacterium]
MGALIATARVRTTYACESCGAHAPRWVGRCPECGQWGTVAERAAPAPGRVTPAAGGRRPVRLADLVDETPARISTGIAELDRVLGGGLVAGSLVLIGGEPGIGKSTLVLQALAEMSRSRSVLLVTGEESPVQVRGRGDRLEADCGSIQVLAETGLEAVVAAVEAHAPAVVAIDSVQTLHSAALDGIPGAPNQVRQATVELMRVAKERGCAIVLVGQVTKDGGLAGPRTLEHLVDCVLAFEGDDLRSHRVLRAIKNRFGSTNEAGLFEMGERGLAGVDDPARLYLSEVGERVGSCIFPAVEGSRALLVEVQALVGPTEIVPPRRVAIGVDRTRLSQVIAVLSRHGGLHLGDQDVFVSVAGGARALDPAADLAIALAVASAHRGIALPSGTLAFGELGLTGAVRPVGHGSRRLAAGASHGMVTAVTPPDDGGEHGRSGGPGRQPAADIRDALELVFGRR